MTYLVKTKSETLLFFYDPKRGLCYQNESEDTVHLLTEEAEGTMDVVWEEDLHVVCQSKKGELIDYCYRGGVWHRRVVLNSKYETPCVRHLRLWKQDRELWMFYSLDHKEETLLVCQPLSGTPQPLAKITHPEFFLRQDRGGCLHLFYRQGEQTLFQCYRYRHWSNPFVLGGGVVADVLLTKNSCGYLVLKEHGTLFYARFEEGELKEKVPIVRGDVTPCLLEYEKEIWMLYEERGRVFYWKKEGGKSPSAMITGSEPRLYFLRAREGEERVRRGYGCKRHHQVSLFLCSEMPLWDKNTLSDDCLIQMTKLKLRVDALEQRVRQLENSKE